MMLGVIVAVVFGECPDGYFCGVRRGTSYDVGQVQSVDSTSGVVVVDSFGSVIATVRMV